MFPVNRSNCRKFFNEISPAAKAGAAMTVCAGIAFQVANPLLVMSGCALAAAGIYKMKHRALDPYRNKQLFRRMPQKDYDRLKKEADAISLKKVEEQTPGSIRALKKGEWGHRVFKHEWVPIAFKAHFEKHLDESELSRLMIYDACCRESTNGVIPVQAIGSEKGMDILRETLKGFLSEPQLEAFQKAVDESPEDSQFFLIETDMEPPENGIMYGIRNLTEANLGEASIHRFLTCTMDGATKIAIFPPQMFQRLLEAKYKDCLSPLLIFSQSNREILSNNKTRPIRIPNPYTECPRTIHDTVPTSDAAFYVHDLYHIFIEDAIGRIDRHTLIEFAKFCKERKRVQTLKSYETILDRALPHYSNPSTSHLSRGEKYWIAISNMPLDVRSEGMFFLERNKDILSNEEILGRGQAISLDQLKTNLSLKKARSELQLEIEEYQKYGRLEENQLRSISKMKPLPQITH